MHDVKIEVNHFGLGVLSVDGVPLQNFVRGFELKSKAGTPTELVLDVPPASIDGQAAVVLRKLGIMIDGGMIEMTWENLRRFFVWAKEHGSDSPYIDGGETSVTIDGNISREDLERFVKQQEPPV